ncbi:MAG: hypothetical protein Q8P23_02605 [bacterium]|nr:hypothetical protein [bacterium]
MLLFPRNIERRIFLHIGHFVDEEIKMDSSEERKLKKWSVGNKLELLTGIQWLFLFLAIAGFISLCVSNGDARGTQSMILFLWKVIIPIVLSFIVSRISYRIMVKNYGNDPFGEGSTVFYLANFFF